MISIPAIKKPLLSNRIYIVIKYVFESYSAKKKYFTENTMNYSYIPVFTKIYVFMILMILIYVFNITFKIFKMPLEIYSDSNFYAYYLKKIIEVYKK